MKLDEAVKLLELEEAINRNMTELSGGELQRVAIAATIMKDADIYFFDEPSSYLDIYQRIKIARIIEKLAKEKMVIVIEHDLAILDFLAENVYLVFGSEGAYGIFAQPRQVRPAINVYLDGYAKEENIRFRDTPIRFESTRPANPGSHESPGVSWAGDATTPRSSSRWTLAPSRSARPWASSVPTPSERPLS